MPPRELTATRTRIVQTAMRLFATRGYHGSSIGDIAREARANPGSVYFFFPSKQDILVAVLDAYHDGINEIVLEPAWKGVADPIARVFALLDLYRSFLVRTKCSYACPIGILALELHAPDAQVRERLSKNFSRWKAEVEACIRSSPGRLPKGITARDLATLVLTVMEGGVMQARTYGSTEAFDTSVRLLKDYLSRLQRSSRAKGK